MRILETTHTCDRCGTEKTRRGDQEFPPMGWAESRLDLTGAIHKPLLCLACRELLFHWLMSGGDA